MLTHNGIQALEYSDNYSMTSGKLLDYLYHQKYYKLIGIDLWRQANTNNLRQINFIGKLEGDNDAAMFLYRRNAVKNYF